MRNETEASSKNTTTDLSFAKDPVLLKEYRAILNTYGNAQLSLSLTLMIVAGVIDGLVYLVIIPTAGTIATGKPTWGMGLSGWLITLAVLAVVGAVTTYAMTLSSYRAALEALRLLLIKVGDQLAKLPLGWFTGGVNGRISRLVTDGLLSVGSGLAHFTVPVIRNTLTALTLLVGVSIWNPVLGLTLGIALAVIVALTLVSNKLEKKSHDMKSGSEQELAGRIVEYASCQSALRSAGRSTEYEPLLSAVRECERRNRVSQWVAMAGLAIGGMSAQLTVVAVIMVTVQLSLSGSLDPVATVVFIGIALRFMRNLQDTVNFLVSTESSRVPLRDVHEILNAELLPVPSSSAELTNPGEVSVQNATFSYVPGTPVVRDVSFTAPPRTMTAIVGPSGSGKTTLFKLIARFWDVDSGTVRVGGTDVREQTTEQLMGQLSMVFQDVYLYDDTLIENIRVGREGATDDEVLQAAQLAGCSEIAERLPQSWETWVGEGGGRLSGGERQRVSIARALLKNAPILLFDEATSALDPENEAGVQRSIRELRKHATVLVIAHKLDTVRDADQIIVLDEHGGISQVGTHDELVSAEGLYHRFWQARVDAAGWSLV
jgi:putative ABC transport system